MKEKRETGIRTTLQDNKDCVDNIIDNSYGNNRDNIARYYISIDIGKRNCVVCVTDNYGCIVEETKYGNTLSEVHDFAHYIDQKYDSTNCIAVVQSTANMWIKT